MLESYSEYSIIAIDSKLSKCQPSLYLFLYSRAGERSHFLLRMQKFVKSYPSHHCFVAGVTSWPGPLFRHNSCQAQAEALGDDASLIDWPQSLVVSKVVLKNAHLLIRCPHLCHILTFCQLCIAWVASFSQQDSLWITFLNIICRLRF